MLSKFFGKGKDLEEEQKRIQQELELLEKEKRVQELKLEKAKQDIEIRIEKNVLETISELKREVARTKGANEELRIEVKALKHQLDMKSSTGNDQDNVHKIQTKQMDIFEKNLRDIRKENDTLKERVQELKLYSIDGKLTPANHIYKVSIEKLFSNIKCPEILELFQASDIKFACELSQESFNIIPEGTKGLVEARRVYSDYLLGLMDLDIKIMAIKGERIKQVYAKYRKLYQILNERHMEFISDLDNLDFYSLTQDGFKQDQIKEFIVKKDEYDKESKLK